MQYKFDAISKISLRKYLSKEYLQIINLEHVLNPKHVVKLFVYLKHKYNADAERDDN